MKHFDKLTNRDLWIMKVGEYFTYEIWGFEELFYRKGLIIGPGMMIPIGLYCETIEAAKKQN